MEIPNEQLLPGDIIFVASKDVMGKVIQFMQSGLKMFKEENFIPTHVGLVISNAGLLIESTMEDGVEVHGIHKYIENKNYEDEILIMRNIAFEILLKNDDTLLEKYEEMFTKNWNEKYNYGAWAKLRKEGKKFCSELAFDCLIKANIISSTLKPSKVYPYDLLKLVIDSYQWRRVDAAALFMLSREKINIFFDEQALILKNTIQQQEITIEKLERAVIEKTHLDSSEEIPKEMRDKLAIIFNVEPMIGPLKAHLNSLKAKELVLEQIRLQELQKEKDLRLKFTSLKEIERNWLLLNSIPFNE